LARSTCPKSSSRAPLLRSNSLLKHKIWNTYAKNKADESQGFVCLLLWPKLKLCLSELSGMYSLVILHLWS
jgi:hypothetical protein